MSTTFKTIDTLKLAEQFIKENSSPTVRITLVEQKGKKQPLLGKWVTVQIDTEDGQ